ncbi:MAG: acyl-CoA thioesterase [Candidatus Marinimicrobia bacterium]|nr:acyl-CoA thioesterase [Candidatus Neomarinimicrobiota bacterium]
METFEYTHTVKFSEVDMAGVVFFSRFFEYAHSAFEAFFQHIGWSFAQVFNEGQWGFPLVHAEADYQAPARLGDDLTVQLAVAKLSESAFTMRYRITLPGGKPVASVLTRHVWVDRATFKKAAMPEEVRAKLEAYHQESTAGD